MYRHVCRHLTILHQYSCVELIAQVVGLCCLLFEHIQRFLLTLAVHYVGNWSCGFMVTTSQPIGLFIAQSSLSPSTLTISELKK